MSVIIVVYLLGPIDNVSKEESKNWRKEAYDQLASIGICSLVPGLETISLTPEQIVRLDTNMIKKADCLLANLNYLTEIKEQRIGTGSLIELGMGHVLNKYIIPFASKDISQHYKFLRGICPIIYSNLDKALQKIQNINEV